MIAGFIPGSRRALWIAISAAIALAAALPAKADEAAENFIREVLAEANPLFGDIDEATRNAGIDSLVDKYVDMNRVGLFALAQYARVITDDQKRQYFPLFRRYATSVYRDVLSNYSGQTLEVTNSVDRSERDIIVNSRVTGARPGDEFADLVIHWRVYRGPDGAMSIFDAGADGVWLAIEQQAQFKSVIANNGGGERGIDALIADLRAQVE